MTPKNKLDLEDVTSQISFSGGKGKVWLNEQRIILFSLNALGKFRKEVYEAIGAERCKAFFIRLGYQLGILDGELARQMDFKGSDLDRFMFGPKFHALRGMVLPKILELNLDFEKGELYCENEWENSYEVEICENELGVQEEPACWNLVGYASGYSTALMQKQIFFQEVECVSCGDSRCRTIGKPAEEWDNYDEYKKYFEPASIIEELEDLQSQVEALKNSLEEDEDPLTEIVGQSKPFKNALNMVSKASDSKVSVLLLGETGVGKEVLAKALHKSSERKSNAFVAVNCAAIPPELIESELFGVSKGAFTGATHTRMGKFERAHQGTIFLDEVVELTPRAQASLLRVIQESELERVGDEKTRKIDVRVVAATNEDLSEAVKEKKFRADLYYRLSAYPINIPTLRERQSDIPLFVDHFLEKYKNLYNKKVIGISDRGMENLYAYKWPGNIRELENVIERAVILAEPGSMIGLDCIFSEPLKDEDKTQEKIVIQKGKLVKSSELSDISSEGDLIDSLLENELDLDALEKNLLMRALEKSDGNVSKASRLVGLSRPAFSYRIKKLTEEDI